jgi:hypothetical protein
MKRPAMVDRIICFFLGHKPHGHYADDGLAYIDCDRCGKWLRAGPAWAD